MLTDSFQVKSTYVNRGDSFKTLYDQLFSLIHIS